LQNNTARSLPAPNDAELQAAIAAAKAECWTPWSRATTLAYIEIYVTNQCYLHAVCSQQPKGPGEKA
jgi:hypothetical protein